MKQIILSQGKYTKVDDDDFDYLNQFKWYAIKNKRTYYAARAIKNIVIKPNYKYHLIFMHNVIMNGNGNDHIDNDGLNNQKYNLRKATIHENARNKRGKINGTSKYKGVYYRKDNNKWQSSIRHNKKLHGLGCYNTEIEAALAYDIRAKELFGEFAYLNAKDIFKEIDNEGHFDDI